MTSHPHEDEPPWLLLLATDGEVLGAEGAPAEWLGQRLDTHHVVPSTLRTAARSLIAEAHGRCEPLLSRAVPASGAHPRVTMVLTQAVPIRRSEAEVRTLLEYAMSSLTRQATALDVELRVEIDESVPTHVVVDPEKLAWIVSSLVGNSLRHVKRGTRSLPGGSVVVHVGFDRVTSMLRIEVSDDGPGIAPDVAARLFRRTAGTPHALGLALTVVRDVAIAQGGALEIKTATDPVAHGTVVTLRIPVVRGPSAGPPSSNPPKMPEAPPSGRVPASGRSST